MGFKLKIAFTVLAFLFFAGLITVVEAAPIAAQLNQNQLYLQADSIFEDYLSIQVNGTGVLEIQPISERLQIQMPRNVYSVSNNEVKIPFQFKTPNQSGGQAVGTFQISLHQSNGELLDSKSIGFVVHIQPKSYSIYQTSPGMNVPPQVSVVNSVNQHFILSRNDSQFFSFQLKNEALASASDFVIETAENPSEFNVSFNPNPVRNFVPNTFQTIQVSIDTNSTTAVGTYLVQLQAREIGSSQIIPIGTFSITIAPQLDLQLTSSITSMHLNANEEKTFEIKLKNTSQFDGQFSISISKPFIELDGENTPIDLKPLEEKTLTFKAIENKLEKNSDTSRISFNGSITRVIEISASTNRTEFVPLGITGLISLGSKNSNWLILIVLIIAVLGLFYHGRLKGLTHKARNDLNFQLESNKALGDFETFEVKQKENEVVSEIIAKEKENLNPTTASLNESAISSAPEKALGDFNFDDVDEVMQKIKDLLKNQNPSK